ncbi:acyltransferase family protein [Oceanicoccus sp. KOV_DT_Chl]|uniref:acyltransferase family protein n=1 Tax=Oceanicoccus sp. KOV_DT_Chl TaxID=1904639 RepID=UPI000C7AE2AE|nr:acyltransferase family protein [Oceanicoccus sp. KOV_DT_Chl]
MNNSQRLHGLDFLRALMMSLGVLLHTAQLYTTMPFVDYYWDLSRSISMDALLIFINTFRMPTFFLLSGFFTALLVSRSGLSGMLLNRRKRLLLPFVIFLPLLAISMSTLRIMAVHIMVKGEWGFDPALVEPQSALWNNTHNLWFLYYLMMYVVTAALLLYLSPYIRVFTAALKAGWLGRLPVYSPLTICVVALWLAVIGSSSYSGRISGALGFIPLATVYAYFGLCFLMGWFLFQRQGDIAVLVKRSWWLLAMAIMCLLIGLLAFLKQGEMGDANYSSWHLVLSLGNGFSMVFFMFGLVGLFCRYFTRHHPWVRYFSDSAYWIFIFHSVPMIAIALLMHDWVVAAEIKFLVVVSGTFGACLLSYHYAVRSTAIGALLNGRRYSRECY